MTAANRRALIAGLLAIVATALSGCGGAIDATYGRAHNTSVNGTGAFADLLRSQGHEVRIAVALTDELMDWAEVVVRFAPTPGPIRRVEAQWYSEWMNETDDPRMLYVPQDYDAAPEYWSRVLAELPADSPPRIAERIKEARDASERVWHASTLPASDLSRADEWFAVKTTSNGRLACKTLSGPWAEGVDAEAAAIPRNEVFKVDSETVLLKGDDEPLVMTWTRADFGRVLVVANASFLLNAPLVDPARRPLALRTLAWLNGRPDQIGPSSSDRPRRVAFLEGSLRSGPAAAMPSVFALLEIRPYKWVAAQVLALGLAACLARAPRLGRARPEEPSGADRPVAHPEALGALLARTRRADEARALLEVYRRWRLGPSSRGDTVRTSR